MRGAVRFAVLLLASVETGMAGSTPAVGSFPEQMAPGWDGSFPEQARVGLALLSPPGAYSVAQFELVAEGAEAMPALVGKRVWSLVDSGNPMLPALRGMDLDSLALGLMSDPAVWSFPPRTLDPGLVVREARLDERSRSLLRRTGAGFGLTHLVAVRTGGFRAAADSAESFDDGAWFGIFDLASGSLLYARAVEGQGERSGDRSAEHEWAHQAWTGFVQALQALPRRRAETDAAEPR